MVELKRILLVEDSPLDAELTLAALAECGLAGEVARVRDGVEALDYLHRRAPFENLPPGLPDVVLLDVKMPRVNGFEVLRHIRATASLAQVPVVMLTSSREERDIQSGYELRANAYIVKPVGAEDFFRTIQQIGIFWVRLNQPPGGPRPVEENP
jgi:CheY-like chemotaxis protein